MRKLRDPQIRFWEKVDRRGPDECWQWIASANAAGYGQFSLNGTMCRAHCLAYEMLVGPVPDGNVLDHRCRNRACVNPGHLRVVTRKQNNEHLAVHRASKSGYRGVAWHKPSGLWHAVVKHYGKQHSGGYFRTTEEAAEAARQLRLSLFTHNDLDRIKES